MTNKKTVLNIVHPYTYKQKGETYVMGPVEEFRDRDERISHLGNYALESGARVLVHNMFTDPLGQAMRDIGLEGDELFRFLFDTRVKTLNTPRSGVPIPNVKPDNIPLKHWNLLRKVFISEQGLIEEIADAEKILFIGGMLECCVTNCMGVFADKLCRNGEQLSYVPELCATYDAPLWQATKPKLDQRGVKPINYSEAMALF